MHTLLSIPSRLGSEFLSLPFATQLAFLGMAGLLVALLCTVGWDWRVARGRVRMEREARLDRRLEGWGEALRRNPESRRKVYGSFKPGVGLTAGAVPKSDLLRKDRR